MKKPNIPDFIHQIEDDPDEEREILGALKRGELKPVKDDEEMRDIARQAARNYMEKKRKDGRVTLRLSSGDIHALKERAAKEGLPYQTMIASILHKYVTGRLSERAE